MHAVNRKLAIVLAMSMTVSVVNADALMIGDTAPALKVDKWVKGDPVKLSPGKIHVVEFWATWCGPCRVAIPHLTKIQKEYADKGVRIIGVSVDRGGERGTRDQVEGFVEQMGDEMDYAVALDTLERETMQAYLDAFLINGIPCSFLIDKEQKIVWVGHSPEELKKRLDELLAGKLDVEQIRRMDINRKAIEKLDARINAVIAAYFEQMSDPTVKKNSAGVFRPLMLAACGDDPHQLNRVAWDICTAEGLAHRDLDLALQAARKADELTDGEDAAIVDTLARALFDLGQVGEAIKHQKRAIEAAGDNPYMLEDLRATLERYEKAAQE